jgi:drug/metabolite transporter (DMT)-like permease
VTELLFAFSIVVLSQAATLVRYADAHPLVICFWRMLFATGLLLPLMARMGTWRQLSQLDRRDRTHLFFSGLMLFVHFFFFFGSVQKTTVANSVILFSLNPVFTALGAWILFREKVRAHLILALVIGFGGVSVLFAETFTLDHPGAGEGDFWGVLSALCFSVYILTGKHVRKKLGNIGYAISIYAQTTLYALLACWLWDLPFTGYSTTTWGAFAAMAILPTLLGHAVFTYCLNFLDVTFMSCMTLIGPLLAAISAYYLFGEPFTPAVGFAFLLTCASVTTLYWPWIRGRLRREPAGRST